MNFRMNLSAGFILGIFIVAFGSVSCTLNYYTGDFNYYGSAGGRIPERIRSGAPPLVLTDLIDRNLHDVAKNLSRVTHRDFRGIDSYAGFFSVDAYNYNLFFWYFPAKENKRNAPVVLYLEGTPGKATFFSVFAGNGPLKLERNDALSWREDSWRNKHHMIYMESLITPGFSYSRSRRAIPADLTTGAIGYILFEGLKQFFRLFSEIQRNEFYLAGNYYAGLIIPVLSIYLNSDQRKYPGHHLTINLQGIVVESGIVDPDNQLVFGDYLYKRGLIDIHAREEFLARERDIRATIVAPRRGNVYDKLQQLITGMNSRFETLTGRLHPYNLLKDELDSIFLDSAARIQRLTALLAGQVGYRQYNTEDPLRAERFHRVLVDRYGYFDFGNLTERYRVLLYTGNFDILCSYPSTHSWIEMYNWRGVGNFRYSRKEKLHDAYGELVGYISKNRNLAEVLLLNVGHYPSIEKPKRTLELMEKFTGRRL